MLNTLEDLYAYTPYMSGAYGYDMSSIPVTVDAGINMGPFSGFSIALELGGASANEWLMPAMANGANCYEMTKVAGIHYRAALAWDALNGSRHTHPSKEPPSRRTVMTADTTCGATAHAGRPTSA